MSLKTLLLKQKQNSPIPVEEQIAVIYSGINGFIDDVPIDSVIDFAVELRDYLRTSKPAYGEAVRSTKKFDTETENMVKDAIASVKEKMALN